MRIAVNTRLLIAGRLDGWGRFTLETLRCMVAAHPEDTFIFLFDRRPDPSFVLGPNVVPVWLPPQARHPILWRIWFDGMVPLALRRHRADVFLSPDGYLSMRTGVPSVPVIHDLNFAHRPEDLPAHHAAYLNEWFPRYAEKAARIATVSEFSKRDIAERYHIDNTKIDVVLNGVDSRFSPLDQSGRTLARQQFAGGKPYLVYAGSIHPRKNIERLLRAYDAFRESTGRAIPLVMAGHRQQWTEGMELALNGLRHREDVLFTGRVADSAMQQAVGGAEAMVYVSLFEGFGIPIIEAFQAGVPVIASDATSMPEVAGGAALLADPLDVQSIAGAMQRVTEDGALRQRLIALGRQRATAFTWERTAGLLYASVAAAAS